MTRRILVVGGAGYIGSHMVQALLDAGHHPIVLDDLSRGHRDLLPGGEFVYGNCGDAAIVEGVLAGDRIDAVMHFAASSLVGDSVRRPVEYWCNNVGNTATLLSVMLRHGVRRFIFSSTAAVYGEPDKVPIEEDDPKQPSNPYGASKAAVERMLAEAHGANGLQYATLRYFNAAGAHPSGRIGERHDPETHLIPIVLEAALGKRPHVAIYGTDYPTRDGTCVRDYVHVWDLAQAHLLALEALLEGQAFGIYNLGTSQGNTVREVIAAAQRVTGRDIPVIEEARRPGDPAVLLASSERIKRELGWQPRYESIDAIIETAWRWHSGRSGVR